FPLAAAALTLILDGSVVRSYNPPYLSRGHVVAPVMPLLTRVATKIEYVHGMLLFWRKGRFAQIRIVRPEPNQLQSTYVEIAPLLRALGETVSFDRVHQTLNVRTPVDPTVQSPSPFNPSVPQAAPTALFTAGPIETPRPIFSGPPRPRRTPVPLETPSARFKTPG
ncbi:MAG: hypothetical protein ABI182_07550, partial [Candidatus Baltobacteraceae bacterium]